MKVHLDLSSYIFSDLICDHVCFYWLGKEDLLLLPLVLIHLSKVVFIWLTYMQESNSKTFRLHSQLIRSS